MEKSLRWQTRLRGNTARVTARTRKKRFAGKQTRGAYPRGSVRPRTKLCARLEPAVFPPVIAIHPGGNTQQQSGAWGVRKQQGAKEPFSLGVCLCVHGKSRARKRQNKRRAALYPWEKHHVKGNIRAGVCPFWVISQPPQRIEYIVVQFETLEKAMVGVDIATPIRVGAARGVRKQKRKPKTVFPCPRRVCACIEAEIPTASMQ